MTACSLCASPHDLTQCHGGWVCCACTELLRSGKNQTTQAVRQVQRSHRLRSQQARFRLEGQALGEADEYIMEAEQIMAAENLRPPARVHQGAGAEVLPSTSHLLHDTLAAPGVAAIDASTERLSLVSSFGTDVAAMAIDAADTIRAVNSLEKMLAHQLAVTHSAALNAMSRSALESDPVQSVRLANLATRLMDTYQRGLLTLKRLRTTGEQNITVQHVHVADGGQAVVGSVQTGRPL